MLKIIATATLAASLFVPSVLSAKSCPRDTAGRIYPGKEWTYAASAPAEWSTDLVQAAMMRGARSFSAGMLVHKGRVIGQFGDVAAPYETRSIRKVLVGGVIGQLVRSGSCGSTPRSASSASTT